MFRTKVPDLCSNQIDFCCFPITKHATCVRSAKKSAGYTKVTC